LGNATLPAVLVMTSDCLYLNVYGSYAGESQDDAVVEYWDDAYYT